MKEVQEFEDSKLGVKGLVDSGISSIPRFFVHPNFKPDPNPGARPDVIPTIDLSGVDRQDARAKIAEQISGACRELGFFQVVNHGIPVEFLDRFVGAVRGFHEQPTEEKAKLYRREEVVEWNQRAKQVGGLLMELLCEGLGVNSGALKERRFLESRVMVGHYYPYCPQPDLTVGIASHTDPGALTLLLQDQVGGLQVKFGEQWVDVVPVRGALVVNIGDLLQVMRCA
ncbi:unnamed protein product [Linum tenue]|uniref:Fe2OG dioxygenase domain-containing protein n=1 Tax=Linum tenue TaxID=586396 RepID=A0AAV0JWY5_9ROSI|nr:unnamed protein product [Linum tenue]